MAARGRVAIVAVAVIAVVAAIAGWLYWRSLGASSLRDAQAEVTRWETRWSAARECLVGNVARSAKTREALSIHEMLREPSDPPKCTKAVSSLTRGSAEDSGSESVEAAWRELDKAATEVARAYVVHLSPEVTFKNDPLPSALDALDNAHANLRAAAKLPALEETAVSLRVAQIVPVMLDGQPVTDVDIDLLPSARGLVLFAKAGRTDVQVLLTTGAAPLVTAIGEGALRSVPDPSWGVLVEDRRVRAGTFDPKGLMRSGFAGQGVFETREGPHVVAAIGTPTLGTLAIVDRDKLLLAQVANHAIEKPSAIAIVPGAVMSTVDVDGRAALIWKSPNKDVVVRMMRPGDDGLATTVTDMPIGPFCLTAREAWAKVPSGAMRFGGERFVVDADSQIGDLVGCGNDAAMFRDDSRTRHVFICTPDCVPTEIPAGAPRDAALAIAGQELVAIASHGGVLGVWRAGAQPTFYTLPARMVLATAFDRTAMAMSDGAVIDVLAHNADGYAVIRVPTR